jgi:hypothetical protein
MNDVSTVIKMAVDLEGIKNYINTGINPCLRSFAKANKWICIAGIVTNINLLLTIRDLDRQAKRISELEARIAELEEDKMIRERKDSFRTVDTEE